MADEIEIKFRVTPETLQAVPHLRGCGICGPLKRRKLHSVYFDTPNGKLRQKGLTLRIRHAGNRRLQTVKSETKGPFVRNEWECEIAGDLPDLARLGGTPLSRLKHPEFIPLFETVVTRTTVPVLFGDSQLEIALDRGYIRAKRHRKQLNEVEIELKQGDPIDLVHLAQRFADQFDVSYEVQAKSERGFALVDGDGATASGARELALRRKMTPAEAFRYIGMECLRHVVANEEAGQAENPEGIHQMRVGVRRLRAAISLFKLMLADRESTSIKAELKWFAGQLGPARDLDVFVRECVAPLENSASEVKLLRQDLEQRRDTGFEQARAALTSDRYRNLVLKILFWLHCGTWSTTDDELAAAQRRRPATDFAREILAQRFQKISRRSRKLRHLEPYKRHKLRIATKNLRYACEFFSALFKGKRRRAGMIAALEELQDALGRLNDIATHRQMTGEIVRPPKRRQKAFAMGLVTARDETDVEALLSAACRAARHLGAEKPFWR